jgi:hypothetical protein
MEIIESDSDGAASAGVQAQTNPKAKKAEIVKLKVSAKGRLTRPLGDRKRDEKLDTSQRWRTEGRKPIIPGVQDRRKYCYTRMESVGTGTTASR